MTDIKEINNDSLKQVSGGCNLADDLTNKIRVGATYQKRSSGPDAPIKFFAKVTSIDGDKVGCDVGKLSIKYYDGGSIVKFNQLNSYPINFFVRDYNVEKEVTNYKWAIIDD